MSYELAIVIVILVLIIFYFAPMVSTTCEYTYARLFQGVNPRTVTYFGRPTCPFCVEFNPIFEKLEADFKYTGIEFVRVDTSNPANKSLIEAEAAHYPDKTFSVPHVVITDGSKRFVFGEGVFSGKTRNYDSIRKFILTKL